MKAMQNKKDTTPATSRTARTTAPVGGSMDEAVAYLQATLGPDGWRVFRTRTGVKARWRWLSLTLKYDAKKDRPWRARLRDGFPRMTVNEARGTTLLEAVAPVAQYARDCARFCDGRLGLIGNPSKSYLGHRLWQAVRPVEP